MFITLWKRGPALTPSAPQGWARTLSPGDIVGADPALTLSPGDIVGADLALTLSPGAIMVEDPALTLSPGDIVGADLALTLSAPDTRFLLPPPPSRL